MSQQQETAPLPARGAPWRSWRQRVVFLESGYAGATIDAIVECSGGSKAANYACSGTILFGGLISDWAERFADAFRTLAPGASVDQSLGSLGRS